MTKEQLVFLRDKVINDFDRSMFNDVIGCYEVGLYRPAYIMAWICIVESLKRKLHLLSSMNRSDATASIEAINSLEASHRSTDVKIYEEAIACGLISSEDQAKITFFWGQRCLYAHPYTRVPDIEDIDYIITEACKLTLHLNIFLNREQINQRLSIITNAPYFLSNNLEEIKTEYLEFITLVPRNLQCYLFKSLLYNFSLAYERRDIPFARKLRFIIELLLMNTIVPLSDENWKFEDKIAQYPETTFIGIVTPNTWVILPDNIKNILLRYLLSLNLSENHQIKLVVKSLMAAECLSEEHKTEYLKAISAVGFSCKVNYVDDPVIIFSYVTSTLINSDFNIQNEAIDFIRKDNERYLKGLNNDQLITIGSLLVDKLVNSNYKAHDFIGEISRVNNLVPDQLRRSIVINILVDKLGKLRSFDVSHSIFFIRILSSLTEKEEILSSIDNLVTSDKVAFSLKSKERKYSWIKGIRTNFEIQFSKDKERMRLAKLLIEILDKIIVDEED